MAKSKRGTSKKSKLESFIKRALELGAKKAKIISTDTVVTAPWVRFRCQYGCPMFGMKLSCPPRSPTSEQTQSILDSFKTAILLEGELLKVTSVAAALEREVFFFCYYKAWSMGDGPCVKCEECSLDKGCRHPYEMRPSMESCGIDVFQTVRNNKWKIDVVKTFDSPHHHFGIVLVE